ncbi:hypothetical protein MMC25_005768 [Agyrium rufum]|nr:hypothetical protein [Agyrium rufum]
MDPAFPFGLTNDNHGYRVYTAIGFTVGITCIAILLRLFSRKIQKTALGADDYFILAGAISTIVTAGLWGWGVRNGIGRHLVFLDQNEIRNTFLAFYVIFQTYGVALTLIKISILLFYRKIFSTAKFRVRVNIVATFALLWMVTNAGLAIFQCSPIRKAWDVTVPGHCIDPLHYIIGVHVWNLVLDIIILGLPVSEVWKLQMSLSKKISVASIFLLGALSVVIALVRLVVILKAELIDITWYTSIASWTCVEPGIEVLSVSLPVMAPLLQGRRLISELRSSLRSILPYSTRSKSTATQSLSGDRSGVFHEFDKSSKILAPEQDRWVTSASHQSRPEEGDDYVVPDHIPLRSIMVTEQVDVKR